ncbi:MAG: hypothetical protein QN543_05115, partial [Nitrososphaeraceae archaeon]|nr:hypothetical protein [Nitrososphaeraceae archaeon]MDW0307971.1 hypothetical protein [Nitrososphaeraceae archaeon]
LNTKNILMFVALSLGILTALTGTGISQVAPAFADKDECEDNDDKNCNKKEIEQTNDCGITVDNSNNNQGLSENNGGLSTSCSNFAANPDDVEDQSQVGQGQSLEPHDQVFGPTT